jgi:ribosomal protein S18 acetylase RimI-like enzyme
VEVRLAKRGDEAAVAALIGAFRDFYGESAPPDEEIARLVAKLIDDARTAFLLAGEPAVGIAQLRFRPSVWTGTEDAWLEDMFVTPGARRSGAGRRLAEACIEHARARGCRRVQLDANERNEAAIALYESLGFTSSTPGRWEGGQNLYLTKWL